MDTLPYELIMVIALCNCRSFRLFAQAYPRLGRKLIGTDTRQLFRTLSPEGNTLLNGKLHCFDDRPMRVGAIDIGMIMNYQKYNDPKYIHTTIWVRYGRPHRQYGPAIMYGDDYEVREWYIRGVRHNIHGPAVEYRAGYDDYIAEWWLEGERYCKDEHRNIVAYNQWHLDNYE